VQQIYNTTVATKMKYLLSVAFDSVHLTKVTMSLYYIITELNCECSEYVLYCKGSHNRNKTAVRQNRWFYCSCANLVIQQRALWLWWEIRCWRLFVIGRSYDRRRRCQGVPALWKTSTAHSHPVQSSLAAISRLCTQLSTAVPWLRRLLHVR